MIKNKIVSLIYKTILITVSFIAVYNIFYSLNANTFAYYTILSNICVFGFMLAIWIMTIIDVVKKKEYEGTNTHLVKYKGIATLCITITGIIFMFFLADYSNKGNYGSQNLSTHYIVPIMMILDFILFDEKGLLKWYHPLIWVAPSLCYLPYIFIRAAILGPSTTLVRYPYFFLDLNKGTGYVVAWCIGIAVIFTLLSYVAFIFDKYYAKKHNN